MFREAIAKRRCLIPANALLQPRRKAGLVQTFAVRPRDRGLMGFAGLWEGWQAPDGSWLRTVALITVPPNRVVTPIHDRMPAILDPADYPTWLGERRASTDVLQDLLRSYDDDALEAVPIVGRI